MNYLSELPKPKLNRKRDRAIEYGLMGLAAVLAAVWLLT